MEKIRRRSNPDLGEVMRRQSPRGLLSGAAGGLPRLINRAFWAEDPRGKRLQTVDNGGQRQGSMTGQSLRCHARNTTVGEDGELHNGIMPLRQCVAALQELPTPSVGGRIGPPRVVTGGMKKEECGVDGQCQLKTLHPSLAAAQGKDTTSGPPPFLQKSKSQ